MPLINAKSPAANPLVITAKQAVRYSRAALNSLYGRLRATQRELARRAGQGNDYTTDEYFAALAPDADDMKSVMTAIEALLEVMKPSAPAEQTPPDAQNVDEINTPKGNTAS
jgi:hypothetical protein